MAARRATAPYSAFGDAPVEIGCEACGQIMRVPPGSEGRRGQCPACGHKIHLSPARLHPLSQAEAPRPGGGLLRNRTQRTRQAETATREAAARRFAEAVDLYGQGRYAEALYLLDALKRDYPANEEIDSARAQCLAALGAAPAGLPAPEAAEAAEAELTCDTVRRVVLEKLLYGRTESVQLEAAELAARLLGMLPHEDQAHAAKSTSNGRRSTPAKKPGTARKSGAKKSAAKKRAARKTPPTRDEFAI